MTDEQVDRIVRALEGSGDSWTTWGIPVLTLIIGFALAQGQEWLTRRRNERESLRQSRRAIVTSAKIFTADFMATPAKGIADNTRNWTASLAESAVSLAEQDLLVGNWFIRQFSRAGVMPADKHEFTKLEADFRSALASSIMNRLEAWAKGKIRSEEFHPAHDAKWDAENGVAQDQKANNSA